MAVVGALAGAGVYLLWETHDIEYDDEFEVYEG